VATKIDVPVNGVETTKEWIETAHDIEKTEFFKILRSDITEKLVSMPTGAAHA
jgi:hypothetical protein